MDLLPHYNLSRPKPNDLAIYPIYLSYTSPVKFHGMAGLGSSAFALTWANHLVLLKLYRENRSLIID